MKLIQISDSTYYIPGATATGVVRSENRAILIDTGLDRESGRRILRLIQKNGLDAAAIINTHSHADHFGGNSFIVRRTDAKVYAPAIEAGIIQYPYLEPLYLFSAHPVNEMMSRFLMAEPSRVDRVITPDDSELSFEDLNIRIVSLTGHSPSQIGVEVEGTLYCADSVFSRRIVEKYGIPLFMDIGKQKETLSFLERSSYEMYVPCHGEPVRDMTELVDINLNVITKVEEFLKSHRKATTDEILKSVCREFGIKLSNFIEYSLVMSAIRAYLSHLYNRGEISAEFGDTLYWKPS